MFNLDMPVAGSLLISEPFMLDPNFERSVVLLCEHSDEGSMGFVLNQQSTLILPDLLEDAQNNQSTLYFGGPVGSDALYFIHRAYDKLLSGEKVYQDIYIGGDFDKLMLLINEDIIQPDEVRFFLGYSGWGPNQLNKEINQNSWAVHRKFDSSLAFVHDGEDLWKKALIDLGPKYAHIANFPKSPDLN